MTSVGALLTLLFFACAMYGWGALVRRATGLPAGAWPMTMAIGVAAWIAIGGLLNLLHIAYSVSIYLLLAVGCAFLAKKMLSRDLRLGPLIAAARQADPYLVAWLGLASVMIGFTVATQLSPSAFNHHDDYQKYFAHVARMLQTGTLPGSPLNTLGAETLGAQAFLQAAFVLHLPLAFINAADAVFCFSLLVLLTGGIALGRRTIAPVALVTCLAVWMLEPQYVNITSLYSAAVLIFAVVALTVDRREHGASDASGPSATVIGLIYAALMALKPTFGLFIVLHFLASTAAEAFSSRRVGATMRHAGAIVGWSLVFLAPWAALYAPLYWSAFAAPLVSPVEAPVPAVRAVDLLSTRTLFYGGSYAVYTMAAATPLICGAVVAARGKWSNPDVARYIGISTMVPVAYLFMVLAMGPLLAGYGTALRHFLPILIGVVPAFLVLGGLLGASDNPERQPNLALHAGLGLAAILTLWLAPGFWTRTRQLIHMGTMLSYVRHWPPEGTSELLTMSREMLRPQGPLARKLAELQLLVPAGEPLLVWITAPFLLDFARNKIIDVDIGGVANPWSRTPPVTYVLWQYDGPYVRSPADYERQMGGSGRRETYLAARGLAYFRQLEDLASKSKVLSDDGIMILLRLGS